MKIILTIFTALLLAPLAALHAAAADTALARYTLDTLPNKVMAREYQLALPSVK